jgi:two-component system chemotaxis response regulator CheY
VFDRKTAPLRPLAEIRNTSIGLVDSYPSIAPLLRDVLAIWDMRRMGIVGEACDPMTLAQLSASQPDILIINAIGRLSSSLALAAAVRNRHSFPDPFLPMIIVMANVTRERVLRARDTGIDEFLAFPFSAKALYQRIESIVFDRRGFVATPSYFGPDRRRGAMATYLGADRRSGSSLLINARTRQTYLEIG